MRAIEDLNEHDVSLQKFHVDIINATAYDSGKEMYLQIHTDGLFTQKFRTRRAIEVEIPFKGDNIKFIFSRGSLEIDEEIKSKHNIKYDYMYHIGKLTAIADNRIYNDSNYTGYSLFMDEDEWNKLKKALNKAYAICFNDEISIESKEMQETFKKITAETIQLNKEIVEYNLNMINRLKSNLVDCTSIKLKGTINIERYDKTLYILESELRNKLRKIYSNVTLYDYFAGRLMIDRVTGVLVTIAIVDAFFKESDRLFYIDDGNHDKIGVENLMFQNYESINAKALIIKHDSETLGWVSSNMYDIKKVPIEYRYAVAEMMFILKSGFGCTTETYENLYGIKYFNKIMIEKWKKGRRSNNDTMEDIIKTCEYVEDDGQLLLEKFRR